jgi:CheY-like chemotaxis protein
MSEPLTVHGGTADALYVRVLVVDDSGVMRQLSTLALEARPGWDVRAVESGSEALEHGIADPPDVILLDSEMPGLDGTATLAALRADPRTREVPVIMVTATEHAEARAEFKRLGAMGVIQKPFAIDRLAAQVSDLMAGAA